ncbi:DNA polymerase elongation subunit (family B) [Halogranum tailed virus 1]|uniref:DNA-directed DNA polymerase n=1 Tax=Halogranum tailed virus 1 TaxID=1273749 RepID=R4T6Q3_9CAUD|nr:DNA polymerase elongation subunit (family B) [Halogranum tailed virus 1]AGM11379.1 DNA polymerase elongation subunit (family B) [Halogranum tailed virus 1]
MSGLTSFSSERETLKVMTMEYTVERDGHRIPEPIVQLFCRDAEGNRRYVEVEGFYPYFYISEREFRDKQDDLLNEGAIRSMEARSVLVKDEHSMNTTITEVDEAPATTLQGRNLVKIETVEPKHVSELRDFFDESWEGDVFFTNRFLISTGIKRGFTLPSGEERVHVDDIEATEDLPDVDPRMVTIDIEVWSGGVFPDTEEASKPITSYTLHDTYDDEYKAAILKPSDFFYDEGDERWESPEWELPDGVDESQIEIDVFEDEAEMLASANEWIIEKDPDLLTGWNSSRNDIGNGFDYPYWINRCQKINEWSFSELSPLNQTFTTNSGTPFVKGREMFDMLQAYKKTQIHEKKSYSLGYIANDELGYGKEDIESLDEGWKFEPVDFMRYNIRDVEAVVKIEEAKGVLDMYDHIRHVTGTSYSECADSNIGIIDVLFLRQAYSKGMALPTSTKPERGWYYGGKVFNPIPGKHKNVVYPDLASLYPYLMWSLNVSPETVFDSLEEAAEAGYEEDDLYRAFVDRRDDDVKRDSPPQRSPIYYTKPEVKEGFVREVITMMTDMKYEYKKDKYSDEKYGAVKRIVNSLYGVFGDSASYGKGFRLFDWRLAETITLAGQEVVTYTSDEFEQFLQNNGYPKAKRVGGDTDSVMTEIPELDVTAEEIQEDFLRMEAGEEPEMPFFQAAQHVNNSYDGFMAERFWINDPDMHKMEVEIESYADSLFFLRDFKSDDPNKGVKKRYSQLVTWDEGEVIEDPEPATKGFELVRSDTAEVTTEVQKGVLHRILKEDEPKSSVQSYLKKNWDEATAGGVEPGRIGIPSAISKPLEEYGGPNKNGKYMTPQPHIRGAKYANAHVSGETITSGDKPLMFYIDRVGYPYPDVFVYEEGWERGKDDVPNDPTQKELGRDMDALSLNDERNLPDAIHIDYDKMANKTLRRPIEPIVKTMGWDFDDLVADSSQSGLAQFM